MGFYGSPIFEVFMLGLLCSQILKGNFGEYFMQVLVECLDQESMGYRVICSR